MRKQKGITLIALVITIIVILILAGISILTLNGENGVIKKAITAKEKTEEAGNIEMLQAEVLGSYGTDGSINLDKLNENLENNIPGLKLDGQEISDDNKIKELPTAVTLEGQDLLINDDGSVQKMPKIIADIISKPTEYYGKKVTNYKANDSDTNTYRIFYVDKKGEFGDGANSIYLKADYSDSSYAVNSGSYDKEENKVRIMNKDWAKERGSVEIENDWNSNEIAAAYLCSPVNEKNINEEATKSLPWSSYYDSKAAKYVIGGPSVEMYIKSYNEAFKNVKGAHTLGEEYSATDYPGYKYKLDNVEPSSCATIADSLNYTEYNSMYCGKNKLPGKSWWLASPSSFVAHYVCFINGSALGAISYSMSQPISPIICLKSSFIPEVEE